MINIEHKQSQQDPNKSQITIETDHKNILALFSLLSLGIKHIESSPIIPKEESLIVFEDEYSLGVTLIHHLKLILNTTEKLHHQKQRLEDQTNG